ncbi:hypothetical protein BDV96DRAFT_608105 [Lophiotrema nucula]|uniref:BZIP domain-containing protein n=1 Tax=Lophiotrema nucula TaxID=690887 RepID=A0A6A5YFE4_9PLEO|nr:hypothetical protein BDV96DRAFT_608105 [Lophiotrema nucula]
MANFSIVDLPTSMIGKGWVRDEDDWSGISEPKERRKIQNRRNQRKRRAKGRRELETCENIASEGQQLPSPHHVATSSLVLSEHRHMDPEMVAILDAVRTINILDPESERNRIIMRAFEAVAHRHYMARKPEITLLPTLSQFNFVRALLANVDVLGLSSEEMNDNALSPFNSWGPRQVEASRALESRLPLGLKPTGLQRATLHHPWIDLLPVPEMRDNLFRRGLDYFDEDELCHVLCGRSPGHPPGIFVWRDPWDSSGWEVTESFVRSWGWVIAGCLDLFRSTNSWRARRGEKLLFRIPS